MTHRHFYSAMLGAIGGLVLASSAQGGMLSGTLSTVIAEPDVSAPAEQSEQYAIPGAEIRFCEADSGAEDVDSPQECVDAITDSDGFFYLPDIPSGEYEIFTESSDGGQSRGIIEIPESGDLGVSIITP